MSETLTYEKPEQLQKLVTIQVPDNIDIKKAYPNPVTQELGEGLEEFPEQPRLIGESITEDQFDLLLHTLEKNGGRMTIKLNPQERTAQLPSEFAETVNTLMPVLASGIANGSTILKANKLNNLSDDDILWHVDTDELDRRYIISNKDGQTTKFANKLKYYTDEDGEWIDNEDRLGGLAQSAPVLDVPTKDIWSGPALTFVAFSGSTLHRRPPVDVDRYAIAVFEY